MSFPVIVNNSIEQGFCWLKLLPITDIDVGLVYACLFVFGGWENDFLLLNILLSPPSPKKNISDVNKTYIDIGNWQKFELIVYLTLFFCYLQAKKDWRQWFG